MPTVLELHYQAFDLAEKIDGLPKGLQTRNILERKHDDIWWKIAQLEARILLENPKACVMGFRPVCRQETKGVCCWDCLQECPVCHSNNWWFRKSGEMVCGRCHPDPRDS